MRVSKHDDTVAFRAVSSGIEVDLHVRVPGDVQQGVPSFFGLIDLLHLERVEPDPTAAPLADVHLDRSRVRVGEFSCTSRTLHDALLSQFGRERDTYFLD